MAQREILQGFERDMEQLAALQLHTGARTERHSRLIHLIPEQKMRDWAARCKHDHDHFAKKVCLQPRFMQAFTCRLCILQGWLAYDA